MLTVYGDAISGNCYKIQLLLAQLQLPYRWQAIDVVRKEAKTPEFLARNPVGAVPVLEIEPGVHLAESNAILCYLADGSPFLPGDRLARARVLQWLFYEQYSHEPYIAVARFIHRYLGRPPEQEARLQEKMAPGYRALAVMDAHLTREEWFAAGCYTIADISLYAYTHCAHEGGFSLAPYPAVQAWLARVQAQPHHVPMAR